MHSNPLEESATDFDNWECNTQPDFLDISGWSVMPHKCGTCPFQEDEQGRYRDPAIVSRVQEQLLEGSQICHHPRLHGGTETHLCRGARDWQLMLFHRLGWLEEPTDECWSEYLERCEAILIERSPVEDLAAVVSFGRAISIDIEITSKKSPINAFFDGVWIEQGRFWINPLMVESLGDVLHEMGHFAVSPSWVRPQLCGDLEINDEAVPNPILDDGMTENPEYRRLIDGDEYAAIAWSYAASIHLGIDFESLYDESFFDGDWNSLARGLKVGAYPGINNLQHIGMSTQKLFPAMLYWLQT